MMMQTKPSAAAIALAQATLLCCCSSIISEAAAAQHVDFDGSDTLLPTALQLLRGAGGVGEPDVHLSATPKVADVDEEYPAPIVSNTKQTVTERVQSFTLKEGITLTLSSAEVDKNFCDPSSPLSLAGYMNGEIDVKCQISSVALLNFH